MPTSKANFDYIGGKTMRATIRRSADGFLRNATSGSFAADIAANWSAALHVAAAIATGSATYSIDNASLTGTALAADELIVDAFYESTAAHGSASLGQVAGRWLGSEFADDGAGIIAIKAKTDLLTFTVANQVDANALSISGDGVAADNLELAYENGLPFLRGQVHVGAATTTTTFETDTAAIISRADDFMNSGLITFVSGALQGMTFRIADWVTATNVFTLSTMPTAPANDDWFIIIGRQTS